MRLPFLRFTVRRMMVMVGLVGISTWLVSTAVKVTRGPHELYHHALQADDGELCSVTHGLEGAFWPRYWRALLGRPWPGSYRCSCQNQIEAQTGIHLILMDSSISDQDAVAYIYRGAVAMTKRDYDQAIAENTEAIRRGARDAAAYTNRGVAWMQKGDYDRAIADFDVAIRRASQCAKAYWGRAGAWSSKQDFDKAIADYTAAIRLDPRFTKAYGGRATAWHSKQDFDKAIADYNEVIRLDPQCATATAYVGRGMAWQSKKVFDKAIADFTEAIRRDPEDPLGHNACAWLWATCPDADYRDGTQAVAAATHACELSAWKNAGDLDTLAAASAEAGDFDAAVKCQEKALEQYQDEKARESARTRLALYWERKPYREEPR